MEYMSRHNNDDDDGVNFLHFFVFEKESDEDDCVEVVDYKFLSDSQQREALRSTTYNVRHSLYIG